MTFAVLAFAIAAAASACLEPSGARITAADLAPAVAGFGQLPPDLVISFAPQPGFTRVFSPAELAPWLARHKVAGEISEPVCVSWKLDKPNPDEIRTAMLRSLPDGADLTVLETSEFGVPRGELVFPLSGLHTQKGMWKGYVVYTGSAKFDIWAKVDLRVPWQRVVAAADLRPGMNIEAAMLRLESGTGNPISSDTAHELAEVGARVPRRLIPSGLAVLLSALEEARTVRKGDSVQVSVISGGAQLSLGGLAEAAAGTGQPVAVRLSDTGKVVRARVRSAGHVVLDVTPGVNP